MVNKPEYRCSSSEAGCTELGLVSTDSTGVNTYETKYRMLDPDHAVYGFEAALCEAEHNFCQEYLPTGPQANLALQFKDPQNRTCEYKTNVNLGGSNLVSGWFITNSAPYDGNDVCQVEGVASAVTVCDESLLAPQDGCYTFTCASDQSSCTEFQDPLFPEGCNKNQTNPDAADACEFYYLLKDSLVDGQRECEYIDASEGCVGFFETDRDTKFLRADCQPGCNDIGGALLDADCNVDALGVDPNSKPGCIP